jgi:hypothetical protein
VEEKNNWESKQDEGTLAIGAMDIRGAQTAVIPFSTFLDVRPVSAAHDV